ncbi:MAG: DUF502 domain-containing protein [Mariprofundaceae bacterium]
MTALRRWFIAGLIVLIPMAGTVLFVRWLIGFSDYALALLPEAYRPESWLGVHIPGLGVVLAVIAIGLVGMLATNFFGRRLMVWFDAILARVPIVRSIYGAIKQLMESVLGTGGSAFQKVVLVSFPQKGEWTLGFVTGPAKLPWFEAERQSMMAVFIPTTPNPTSGWLLFVPEKELITLPMTVEDGLKMVVSGGMVAPKNAVEKAS